VRIGVLGGTGPAGQGLAVRLAAAGLEVVIGSRSKERAEEICLDLLERWPKHGLAITGGDNVEAASTDLVVVATPWDAAAPTAASVAHCLTGKVVVSMANALVRVAHEFVPLIPPRGSIAAWVQEAVPEAMVSAALHHLPARELGDLAHELEADVLLCSDHAEATRATAELIDKVPGLRAVDAGSLSSAMAIEALTPVLLQVNVRYKTRSSIRLTNLRIP
jgi:8-hydroxy-5-deazaflavin:NADPH oxidoreductase